MIGDIRDILKAVDRLRPHDLPLQSRQTGEDSTGWETWAPSYRTSESGESVHRPPTEAVFHDHKEGESFGLLGLFAAEQGITSKPWDRLEGSDLWEAVDAAREAGAPIPHFDANGDSPRGEPVAALPLARLDAMDETSRRHELAKRGVEIPTTEDARQRLEDGIFRELRVGNHTVIDASTALGKTGTVSRTPWMRYSDVTGEQPVVHLHRTREARDQAAEQRRKAGVQTRVLKGRTELGHVAAGDHDPPEDADAEPPEPVVTVDGQPASEWMDEMCDRRGLPFSTAHAIAREHNDQGHDVLPCCEEGDCPAASSGKGSRETTTASLLPT